MGRTVLLVFTISLCVGALGWSLPSAQESLTFLQVTQNNRPAQTSPTIQGDIDDASLNQQYQDTLFQSRYGLDIDDADELFSVAPGPVLVPSANQS